MNHAVATKILNTTGLVFFGYILWNMKKSITSNSIGSNNRIATQSIINNKK